MHIPPKDPIPVGLLGATGAVGQVFVARLQRHPWFRLVRPMASSRSVGRTYGEAARWVQPTPLESRVADQLVETCDPNNSPALIFSALDASVAAPIETAFAESGRLVVTNTKCHRMAPDVPLLVPEVNPGHLELAHRQSHAPGGILANPNCSTIGLVLALKPLHDAFGIERVHVVSMQALSGAGIPGVPSLVAADNVVPFIGGEEEKLETESRKIFGSLGEAGITPAELTVSATCTRVPVIDGHTLCVSVGLRRQASRDEILDAWREFRAEPQELSLPSAPASPIVVHDAEDAPQPRLHRGLGDGMAVSVGRLRDCSILDFKFVTLSHNTVRGAAGGSLLLAELAAARGMLPDS